MTTQGTRSVVVGTDGSDAAQAAVEYAADLADRRGAPLEVVHAFEPSRGAARRAARRMLDDTLEVLRLVYSRMPVRVRLEHGPVVGVLVEESRTADTLVVGSRGSGRCAGRLLGSTSLAVTAQAHCPVVAVPAPRNPDPVRHGVVVGVGRAPRSEVTLEYAFHAAAASGDPLLAVRAWSEPFHLTTGLRHLSPDPDPCPDEVREPESQDLMAAVQRWRHEFPGVAVRAEVVVGHPAKVLLDRSREARLLVVGCRGRDDIRAALVGSTSHAVLHQCDVPVAVVPSGWNTGGHGDLP